jgi:hypothetical protein
VDPRVFRSGRDFAAWIGLVPRQDSTGGVRPGHFFGRIVDAAGGTDSLRDLLLLREIDLALVPPNALA